MFSGVCKKIPILCNVFLAVRGPANLPAVGWLVGLLVGWLAGPGLAGSLLAGLRARWSYSYLMAGLLAGREAGWARPLFFFFRGLAVFGQQLLLKRIKNKSKKFRGLGPYWDLFAGCHLLVATCWWQTGVLVGYGLG